MAEDKKPTDKSEAEKKQRPNPWPKHIKIPPPGKPEYIENPF